MDPTVLSHPVQDALSCDYFDVGAAFVQQGRRFKGTLTSADHNHGLSFEPLQISPLGGMSSKRRRQTVEFSRPRSKRANSSSNHDPPTVERFSISQGQFK